MAVCLFAKLACGISNHIKRIPLNRVKVLSNGLVVMARE